MHLKLLLLLFPGKARTLLRFSLIYPLINFYAIVVMCVHFTYILNSTIIVSVVLKSVHSDSPSDAHISSCSIVLTSETIFLPEKLPLVFLLAEVCWQLIGFCFCAHIFLLPSFLRPFSLGVGPRWAVMLSQHVCCVIWPQPFLLETRLSPRYSLGCFSFFSGCLKNGLCSSVLAALQKRGNIAFILRFVEFFGSGAQCLLSPL